MAFLSRDLSVLAYANGFTLWHYTTPDAQATVTSDGYFNGGYELLHTGDMIIANTDTQTTPGAAVLVVASHDRGAVRVANIAGSPPAPAFGAAAE